METNKLTHFITTYDTQNLRQAATILNMSHSALSKSLKTLEGELGFRLFVPNGRGITHTEEAKNIYYKAKNIVKNISDLADSNEATSEKKIRIATFEVFSTYFLQVLLKRIENYDIEIHENLPGDLEKSISRNNCDFGITYDPIPFQGIDFLKITDIKMSPYVRVNSFEDTPILKIPFAAPLKPIEGAPSGVKGLDGWPEHKFPRVLKYQVGMMESAIELARLGKCAVFLPDFVANLQNRIALNKFKLTETSYPNGMKVVRRSVYLVKRKNQEETIEMKKVCASLRLLNSKI